MSKGVESKKIKLLIGIIFCILLLAFIPRFYNLNDEEANTIIHIGANMYGQEEGKDFVYLSDIEYIASQSYTRYDRIRYDEVNGGGKITLKIENGAFSFDKGIWAHATSQVTYDIRAYDYKYFTAFIGLNTTSSGGNGVKYYIYTSEDGVNWGEPSIYTKNPQENATFIKIDISNANYLRLIANDNGGNGQDHSVYADAKLENEREETSAFKSVEEYNEIIKNQYHGEEDITGELEFNLLKRELIQNVGSFTINAFYNANEDNKLMLDWLMSNQKALRYYILGGKPLVSYYKSLTELSRLYRNYKEDFENKNVTKYGTELGDLYLRMAVSLSLTHSTTVGLWMQSAQEVNKSDSVRRYAIIKYMHENGLFKGVNSVDLGEWFEGYTVEEMRYVVLNNIDDESILWLNAYTQEWIDKVGYAGIAPHRYIAYVWPNYGNEVYYAEENKEYFNELFSILKKENNSGVELKDANGLPTGRIGLWDVTYTIPGGKDEPEYTLKITRGTSSNKIYKVWMNMRNKFGTGAVCGGISKTGANIRGVHGIPAAVVGQPGHAALLHYSQDTNGNGFWSIDNDVSGWAYTGPGGRSLLGWGNAAFASGYSGTYIPLAQEVMNHNDTYEASAKFVYLASTYSDLAKKEEMYRKSLSIQPLNLDAWYGLIQTYNASSEKTEEEYYELAKEIAENLKYYPLPMYQLTNLIKPKLTSLESNYKFTLLQTRILKEASQTTSTEYVLQPGITRLMANFLLGQMDTTIATFSFDGSDAGKIVLSSRYDGSGIRWDYSINGKEKENFKEVSFTESEEHKWQLTEEEIAAITSEKDLYIHIVGVNYSEENLYKIDIQDSQGLPPTLFASDLENKILGSVPSVQWKYNEEDPWIYMGEEEPDLTGNKTIILRRGATETYLTSNTSTTYTFTEDIEDAKRKYIPISHLSIEAVSTEAVNNQGSATNAIDANYNTRWHSAWNGTDTERYITVKLDQPYNISAVEFVPAAGGNGKIYDGTVWGSMDGENWIVLSQKKNLTYTNAATTVQQAIENIKNFDVDSPQKVQYVKIVADRTNGNWITARAFNFYEDTTIKNVATFSFDGKNAGMISLYDEFKNQSWQYSIDNGKTWVRETKNQHLLTQNEIDQINEINKIKIKLENDYNEYLINIKKGETPEKGTINDFENKLMTQNNKENLEWRISEEENWTSFTEKEPYVEGNKILYVRTKATGITTPSEAIEYEFTNNNLTAKEHYVPIEHLSIHDYTSQSKDAKRPYYAVNAIDGNINTQWHTDFAVRIPNGEAFITIKLDEPRFISAIDYFHMDAEKELYGYMKSAKIYVSENGEDWTEAARVQDVPQEDMSKHISFPESIYGQYVKVVMGSHDNVFVTAAMINIYEDITKIEVPTPVANISYSITTLTNQNVIATITFDQENVEVIGGNTHTFEENGEYVFEYIDQYGIKGSMVASVNWIDKIPPIATITYDKTELTNQSVTATIAFNKGNVIVTNNSNLNTYTFEENGEFTFEYVDEAGNSGTVTANVDWIDRVAPTATITYDKMNLTNQNVTATIGFNENNVTILNNNGSNTYTFTENGEFTFEYRDQAGNIGSSSASVNWIDKIAPEVVIEYSTTSKTNQNVTATLRSNKEIIILNNVSNVYTFTENGEFTFEYVDKAGNSGTVTATVNWIDRVRPMGTITYDITDFTNQNVTATITFDKENVTVTNNNNSNSYVFEKNGEFTFEYVDEAGNTNTTTASVNWIDKVLPNGILTYDKTELTNQNVTVTIIFDKEDVNITNNNGSNTYIFTENGEFTFDFVDKYGNRNTTTATVNWIDKEAPVATIIYSTISTTRNPVIATVNCNEKIYITNNEGKNTYTFEENGEFTFEYRDEIGNTGSVTAHVNWINKEIANSELTYSKTELTNEDVTVYVSFDKENVTILNNNGSNAYTFSENGEFTFEYKDEAGNLGKAIAVVNWIDKIAPTATFEFNTSTATNKDVIVTLVPSEKVEITNNEGKNTYTFEENGEFTFEFKDMAGNLGNATVRVNWIDRVKPNGTITYDITDLTNQSVTATISFDKENVIVTNNNNSNTYTFEKNGEFIFEYQDQAGNTNTTIASVDWIDKELPNGTITYDKTDLTNQNVTATISFDKENVTILNNNGSNTYIFNENGNFEFIFEDALGNRNTAIASVNWIDKVLPNGIITYDKTELTNQSVTATITFDKENITILNNNGLNTYTFTENGKFEFEFIDAYGNKNSAIASVSWIDKTLPEVTISYSITTPTNKSVTATVNSAEEIVITNNNSSNTYTFVENGSFTFEYVDKAGNVGSITAKVDWINKEIPEAKISFNKDRLTNQDVIATITFDKENVRVTNNNGLNTYTFTENGEFTFEFIDEAGNVGSEKVIVCWIDKVLPNGTITYDKENLTNQNVTATITFDKENVTILNNNGSNTYTFEENGEFIFEYRDEAGNTERSLAVVDWIDKEVPVVTVEYDKTTTTKDSVTAKIISNEPIIITNNDGKEVYTFEANGEFTFEYKDYAGNTGTITATVNWIDRIVPSATIIYSIPELTNQNVIATIIFDKTNTKVTNNNGLNTYTFEENGEFIFEFIDEVGNVGKLTAKVDWIDKKEPEAKVTFDKDSLTNQNVTATITFDKENVTVTNNNNLNSYVFEKNGEFTFEYVDKAGNVGSKKVSVNWIDKEAPIANLIYDITEQTTSYVTAYVTFNKPNVKIINNDGKNNYTFIINGEFTFEFIDEAGNKGVILASVNWIKEEEIIIPTDPVIPNTPNENSNSKPNYNYNNNTTIETGYKNYTAQNITLTIPAKEVKEELTLKKTKLILPLSLKEKLGSVSEYFELTLKNDENETINISSHLVWTIELDETKEFLGIYSITDDEIIERLNHKQLEDNIIEIETEKLNKFIISYNEKTEEKPNDEKKDETKEKKHSNFIWYVLSSIVAIMGVLIGYIKIKRTNNQY